MPASAILFPVFVMGLLTVVIFLLMIATRLPAMTAAGMDPQAGKHTDDLRKTLPSNVISVSDNYNHLFEQPTLFYAVAISIAVLGHVDTLHVQCAWAFTIARIAHSLVQVTVNVVLVRFTLFAVAWTALSVMIVREFLALL